MKKLYNLILLSLVCFGAKAQIVNIDQNGGYSGNIVVGQSNYHISESIYLDTEIGSGVFTTAGNGITKIGFSVNAQTTATLPVTINNFKVSMKSVPAATTTFTTGTTNNTGYTVVYNGSITFSALGWNTIILTTPFVRTAGQNLQVKIERSNNITNSALAFDISYGNYNSPAASTNSSRRYNGTAAIVNGTTSLTATPFRPAIQLIRPFPVDAEVIGFVNPYSSCYNAPQTVQVGIKNNGTSPIAAGAASVSLEVATANTFLGTVTNSAIIPTDSIAILTFTGINMPNVGTNDELAVVTVAGDGYHANDSGFSAVTTTPVLSPLPQVEDVEGAFNVFAYLKSVAGSNAWTVLSFISNTGAWQNGWNQNDSLVPRANGGGSDYFIFDSWDQPAGTISRLYSNCISMPASGTSRVSFWMSHDSAYATNLDSLYVIVSNDKGATWTRVGGFQRPNDALLEYTWQQDSVDISAYNGQTIQVGFEGVSYYGNAIGLDDINIYNIVSCSTFVTPTFTQVAAVCAGGTITLPATSTNGITGTWTPAINNQSTTTYTFVPNGGQCVSTTPVTMTVTVNPATVPTFTQVAAICKGGTFTLPTTSTNGVTGTWAPAVNNQTTTTYTFTPAAGVCATTATMTVTVKQPSFSTTSFSNCVNYTWNGQTYTASGTYTKTGLINSVGCDSTAYLNLTIKQPTTSNTSASVCVSSLPYTWNGLSLSAAGSYTKVFANGNAAGCDSTAVLALTVNTAPVTPTFNQVAAICQGGSFTLPTTSTNGVSGTWSPAINNQATTTYTFSPAAGSCATTTTMQVTVTPNTVPTFTQVAAICVGGSFTLPTTSTNGVSGTWAPAVNNQITTVYTFTPAAGVCATTATMTVTVKQPTSSNSTVSNCVSYTWNGVTYSASGSYTKTGLTNAAGCDSVAYLSLTIKAATLSNTSASVCVSQLPYTWNGNSYSATGSYTKTGLTNAAGCDSTAVLNLTVNTTPVTPTFTQVAAICAGGSFSLATNSIEGISGTWSPAINNQATTTYTFTPAAGSCATTATMIVNVTPNTVPTFTQVAAICAGGSFTLPTTSTNGVSGTWSPAINNQATTTYTFTPAAGVCATTATMTVTVNSTSNQSFTQSACDSYTWNGTTYSVSGNYTFANGACSVDTLHLTVTPSTTTPVSQTACGSYPWNGTTYSVSGSYTKVTGCATEILNLTIKQTSSSNTTQKICTNQLPYVWNGLNCPLAGNYTKVLTNVAGCDSTATLNLIDTCIIVDAVVYPNPTDGNEDVTINYANANFQADSKVVISVYDRAGKLVSKSPVKVVPANRIDKKVNLGLKAYSNGVYYIKIETTVGQSARYSTKILKAPKN